jgi:lycopene cyclase domain-containing protein
MNEKFVYAAVNLCSIAVPFIASFHPKIPFYKEFKSAFFAIGITALVFILWDIYFTYLHIWGFNSRYLTGLYLTNLPVEEVFFFVCIPFSCLFLFYCFEKVLRPTTNRITELFYVTLAVVLSVLGIYFHEKLYTSASFTVCAAVLIASVLCIRQYITVFSLSYAVSMIPFFISNGILTGSWIKEPVVMYNNAHNLKIRLLTIPIEDLSYSLSLQLLTLILFVYFRGFRTRKVWTNGTM